MKFQNTYLTLPEIFYQKQIPLPVRHPEFVIFNQTLAQDLDLDAEILSRSPDIFAGNQIPPGAEPIAQAYAGHQFGYFNMLGDGRAILMGEHLDHKGQRWDIQLKGSGRTAFSRGGDGRAALGPMIREYIISEAMHALGIPTTRSLAVVTTGEPVYRETVLPGAVLTRVAKSHIRVGTFEFAAAKGGTPAVKALADYSIQRHYPNVTEAANSYVSFFQTVAHRQAALLSRWMNIGFIHGVMNTDNMSITGETIDYGPCAFMDIYDPSTVYSSIDRKGRYAYGNQPAIAQWNLARLAETLMPLFDSDPQKAKAIAEESLEHFQYQFRQEYLNELRAKLGLKKRTEEDVALIELFLNELHKNKIDFTNSFQVLINENLETTLQMSAAFKSESLQNFKKQWLQRLSLEDGGIQAGFELMKKINPVVIPRNHLIEEVIKGAVEMTDYQPIYELVEILKKPFTRQTLDLKYRLAPAVVDKSYRTFCGT